MIGRERGAIYQLIAVGMSILGLFIGKYYLYYHFSRSAIVDELGQSAWDALGLSLFSSEMIEFFFEDLGDILAAMDLVFFGLAILVAWGIPSIKNGQKTAPTTSE